MYDVEFETVDQVLKAYDMNLLTRDEARQILGLNARMVITFPPDLLGEEAKTIRDRFTATFRR